MKITKTLLAAAGFVALAACGGGGETAENNVDANMMTTDNLGAANDLNMTDMNMSANDLNITANNVTVVNEGANATDANAATNTGNTM